MGEKRNVYENLIEELKGMMRVGALKSGDKLPSVRAYAVERKVNPNTVAKAYSVLEQEGYICVQPKQGAYVAYPCEELGVEIDAVKTEIRRWKSAGICAETIAKAIEEIYKNEEGGR